MRPLSPTSWTALAPVIELLRAEALQTQRSRLDAVWLTELARLLPEVAAEASSPLRPEPMTQIWQRSHLFEADP